MIDGRVIRGVDLCATTFIQSFKRLKGHPLQEAVANGIRSLVLLELDKAPRKLHLHQLKSSKVRSRVDPNKSVNPWTVHVTPDDKYKASFTLEDGMAYFRLVDEHDIIDKCP